jgi:hypothetical protein
VIKVAIQSLYFNFAEHLSEMNIILNQRNGNSKTYSIIPLQGGKGKTILAAERDQVHTQQIAKN